MRRRLLGSVAALLAAFIAVLTLAFNLVLDSRLEHDATDLARSRAASALQGLEVADGRLVSPEAPDAASFDRAVWVFAAGRAIERPRVPALLQSAAAVVAASAGRADVGETRLVA
ncbi:MAG: hypothetical protein QOE31_3520, partial [Solirubrobacteraceae bacterium]|nr:hypothetical protein [Solirubrobacteraceae bacterium]